MKRPLLAVCALVVCLIALWQALFPPDLPEHIWSGEEVCLYGRVVTKEYKTAGGQEKSILYLSDVILFSDLPHFSGGFSKEHMEVLLKRRFPEGHTETEYGEIYTMAEEKQVMVYLHGNFCGQAVKIGQYVLLRGTLADFDRARNPGEFDSRLYYAALGVKLQMFAGQVLWQEREYSRLLERMWQLKQKCTQRLIDSLGEEQGGVLATILLGSKERLDAGVKALYRQSGISHILAISGLHISLVGMGVYGLLRRLGVPPWIAALIGLTAVIWYGVFTNAGASAYRAAGMFVIRMLGVVLKRNYDMLTSLGVLFAWMVLQNPLYLYHSGFLLSFGAMIGIGCIYPLLAREEGVHRYREGAEKWWHGVRQGIKQSLLVSFSVTVVTLPVMCLTFYEIAPYSLVLNLVVLPFLPALFLLGILLIVADGWYIGTIFCILTKSVLNGYSFLARLSLQLPGSRTIVGGVNKYQVLFCVMTLGILILWGKRMSRQGCYKLILIAILFMTVRVNLGSEISFLDVGQGDGIFVQTGGGDCYLIDGGSSSESDIGKYTLAPFLMSKGVREIEAWIITHPDADHCNGIKGVLEAGYGNRVKRILLPAVEGECSDEAYPELIMLAAEYNIPVYYLSAGMQWREDDAFFLCMNPPANHPRGASDWATNEYSVVLYLELGKYTFLLAGDVEKRGEEYLVEELIENGIFYVNVLKVAHHGSKNSTSERFLEELDADVAVISCGENNVYGHPHEETIRRLTEDGCKIITTAKEGAITIRTNHKKTSIIPFIE